VLLLDYFPIFIMASLAMAFAGGTVLASFWVGPRQDKSEKLDTYECGMPPIGTPHERFNVKFFLVAMVFVIFDIEIVFLFLWAVIFRRLGWFGLAEMGIFLMILVFALLYVWEKGVLEWASKAK